MKKFLIIIALVIGAAIVVPMATCNHHESKLHKRLDGTVPITHILSSPQVYDGKTISIKGEVSESTGVFGHSWFVLTDQTGSIHVHGHYLAPADGEEVKVEGVVKQCFKFGNYNGVYLKITK